MANTKKLNAGAANTAFALSVDKAGEQVRRIVSTYLEKNKDGSYVIPFNRQRPIMLMGPAGIGKTDAPMPPDEQKQHTDQSGFQPYKSKYRKAGTGGIYQLNDHLWEGKYSPRDAHGKRISRNVYAKTCEECEEKLAAMIEEMKRKIAAEKAKIQSQ